MRAPVGYVMMATAMGCGAAPAAPQACPESATPTIAQPSLAAEPVTPETSAAPLAPVPTAPTPVAAKHDPFPGWVIAGSGPKKYDVTKDHDVSQVGGTSAKLQAIGDAGKTFVTLMQTVVADKYLGKRVAFSAFVRTSGADGWAGLWLRIDRKGGARGPFDNMQNRPITGTTDWKQYDVVLDVPRDAVTLHFGILHQGGGLAWFDGASLKTVATTVPTTSVSGSSVNAAPTNLSLED